MTLRVCGGCASLFSVGAPYCPQCGISSRYSGEEGIEMARITVHGGVTDRNVEGSEDVSPGNSSETSLAKPQRASEPSATEAPSPAGKTESHSATPRKVGRPKDRASSTADSADASTTGPAE